MWRSAVAVLPRSRLAERPAVAPVVWQFVASRAALWAWLLVAVAVFGGGSIPSLAGLGHAPGWLPPWLHDLGRATDVWARWDSAWLVLIAHHGYAAAANTAAFYPLYPAALGVLGRVLGGHYLVGGIAVSLGASLGAFLLLARLVADRLGATASRRTTLYLALFPTTFFLSAIYTEPLFLLLAVATFALAERERWWLAGAAAGLALLTRPTGAALVPALLLLAWRSPERRRALAGVAAVPALFALYPLFLWRQVGDPLAFLHAELDPLWARHVSHAGPFGGIWDGARAAWAGVRQLVAGSGGHVYWPQATGMSPLHAAVANLAGFVCLVLFLALATLAWRRLGAAYGLYCLLALALPLSVPSTRLPLLSLTRFVLVLFPCFAALGLLGARSRRVHVVVVAASVPLLLLWSAQWVRWEWVA